MSNRLEDLLEHPVTTLSDFLLRYIAYSDITYRYMSPTTVVLTPKLESEYNDITNELRDILREYDHIQNTMRAHTLDAHAREHNRQTLENWDKARLAQKLMVPRYETLIKTVNSQTVIGPLRQFRDKLLQNLQIKLNEEKQIIDEPARLSADEWRAFRLAQLSQSIKELTRKKLNLLMSLSEVWSFVKTLEYWINECLADEAAQKAPALGDVLPTTSAKEPSNGTC